MSIKKNHKKFLEFRKQYPVFEYRKYYIRKTNNSLDFSFLFKMGDDIEFKPSYSVPWRDFYNLKNIDTDLLESLIFHIGMVELISYWKTACPPEVVIHPFSLTDDQVDFWKKLYLNGLGEFFYLNGIKTSNDEFMTITSKGKKLKPFSIQTDNKKVMVPVGGGKDSVVTLELLKESADKVIPMALNPRRAVVRSVEISGFSLDNAVVVNRKLDKKLLELNEKGFLNGHTPFSALLAFVTLLTAALAGIRNIALSNESSANQSTVPGVNVNHQYSKSFEFEQDFNSYYKKYITHDIDYFSFLRPLNELQIAALFSRFPQHHLSFRSCNVGSKNDSWCGNCPKCLFTRIILGPFFAHDKMLQIFGKELLDDIKLKPYFDELTGKAEIKPFECVGTPDEVNAALQKIKEKFNTGKMPVLLKTYNFADNKEKDYKLLISDFNVENILPSRYVKLLKEFLQRWIS